MATIGVLTDLEPDDLIAIAALPQAQFYLVGESDPRVKWARMRRYLAILFEHPEESVVIAGTPSDRVFSREGGEFYDGLVLPDHPTNTLKGKPIYEDSCTVRGLVYVKRALIKLSESDAPMLIILKPPRELLMLYEESKVAFRNIAQHIDLLCYGGFNFRALDDDYDNLQNVLGAFRSVRIYDRSICSPEQLAVTGDCATLPEVHRIIQGGANRAHPFWTAVQAAIGDWNREIEKRLSRKTDSNSTRICEAIRADREQFVIADCVIPLIFHAAENASSTISEVTCNYIYADSAGVVQYANVIGKPAKPWSIVLPMDAKVIDDSLANLLQHV